MKVKVNITLQNIDKLQEHSITTDDLLNKHILENCRTLMLKAMQNNSSEVLCLINTTIYEAHFKTIT